MSSSSSITSAGELENKEKSVYAGREVTLTWRRLTVRVERKIAKQKWWHRQKTDSQVILDNVNGYCKSGVLTAIMGSSGAGKTTLLATVSQRAKMKHEGDIFVNGRVVSRELMAKLSGFVPQHDLVFKSLTVNEHMEFMARLMMDQSLRRIHRNRRIYSLLSELGLLRCCKTPLGRLSGGEMKRLSLAVQLLTDPPLLFCDEPTTGLDSYSAGVVLENLRACAERGKAVLATIHQPASGHFELFHEVLLLAGGRVAYSGPVHEAFGYFNSVGLVCPPSYNPAEFYVQQLAVLPGKEMDCILKNQWLCDQFALSARGKEINEVLFVEMERGRNLNPTGIFKGNWSAHSSTTSESLAGPELDNEKQFTSYLIIAKASRSTQLQWLIWRSFVDLRRNYGDKLLRFSLLMLVAALISTPYIGVAQELNQKTIQNMEGFMYLIITEIVFTSSYSVFHTFPREIPILLRELANGLYQPGVYYMSKMFFIVCRAVFESTIYAVFIFWVAGLNGGWLGCLAFILPIVFASLAATAYGSLMSAAFESLSTATLVSVPIEQLGLIFSGTYLQLSGVAESLSWIKYTSQFYYGQEAVSITQWRQVDHIDCDPGLPCISDGEGVLNKYGYHPDNYTADLFGLSCIYVIANFLGFIAIWLRSRQSPVY